MIKTMKKTPEILQNKLNRLKETMQTYALKEEEVEHVEFEAVDVMRLGLKDIKLSWKQSSPHSKKDSSKKHKMNSKILKKDMNQKLTE